MRLLASTCVAVGSTYYFEGDIAIGLVVFGCCCFGWAVLYHEGRR